MITSAQIKLIQRDHELPGHRETLRAQKLLREACPLLQWNATSASMSGDIGTVMQTAQHFRDVLREGHMQSLTTLVKFDCGAARLQALKKMS